MRIAIDIGHNCPHDAGASGIVQEDVWAKEVGTKLINKLRTAGHTVIETLPPNDPNIVRDTTTALKMRTDKANSEKAEKMIAIHFNAGGGTGSEIEYKTDADKKLGLPILAELGKLFNIRGTGMVYRDALWLLNHAQMPCIIVESLFVDNKVDVARFDSEKISEALYRGITGKPSISVGSKPPPTPPVKPTTQPPKVQPTIPQGAKPGMTSAQIKNIQLAINVLQITDNSGSKLTVDGVMGAKTKEALTKLDAMLNDILK